jgi:hypothetical protein
MTLIQRLHFVLTSDLIAEQEKDEFVQPWREQMFNLQSSDLKAMQPSWHFAKQAQTDNLCVSEFLTHAERMADSFLSRTVDLVREALTDFSEEQIKKYF